jgi:hypothetical protein
MSKRKRLVDLNIDPTDWETFQKKRKETIRIKGWDYSRLATIFVDTVTHRILYGDPKNHSEHCRCRVCRKYVALDFIWEHRTPPDSPKDEIYICGSCGRNSEKVKVWKEDRMFICTSCWLHKVPANCLWLNVPRSI